MTLPAIPVAPGLSYVDLNFQGRPFAIATAILSVPGQVALVDPGPTSCLDTLELGLNGYGLRLADVTDLLLTHIHLDHAGATGTIVRRHPHIRVHVHERGAVHLIDPERLLASAKSLYGDAMDRLWGEFAAVPAGNVTALKGGERVDAGGRTFEVAYTPGHASHHVSFFDRDSGVAFVGDVAGVCVNGGYVLPPTPPPDVDADLWEQSVAQLETWSPQTLFLTHFGPAPSVRPHLQALMANLREAIAFVKASLSEPGTDDERSQRFAQHVEREYRRHMTEKQVTSYQTAVPSEMLWLGIARYLRKRRS
jgi:glyoxylase-like metal-dependent hydrolase (beta-lactamase superfamily II)